METNKVNVERMNPDEVSAKGSLGLLALGAEGLRVWRAAKSKSQSASNQKK